MHKTKKGCSPPRPRPAATAAADGQAGTVYILHFDPPYKHAQHYTGWTRAAAERVETHKLGRGSPLVKAAMAAGCNVTCACLLAGSRQLERRIKFLRIVTQHCPLCGFRPKNHGTKGTKES